uniref:Uncharacterized protein n=1 Tax=Serinus canaria TaxID=9135 RepID=A0A8C9UDM8_SERCA
MHWTDDHVTGDIWFFTERINYLDPSTSAFANSIWHSSTRWVNHRHQSYKAEFLYREVQVVRIKLEAIRELIIRQSQVAESCNTSNPHLLCSYTSGGRESEHLLLLQTATQE